MNLHVNCQTSGCTVSGLCSQFEEDDDDSPELSQKYLPVSLATLADWYYDKYVVSI